MRGFIEELRYRNVFRVAIAYAVVGWLVAQIADLLGDAFNLPDTFLQMVIILLALGFPLALFLAWAFELTPDGMKKAHEVPADAPKDPRSGRTLNRVIIATLSLAVVLLVVDRFTGERPTETESAVVDRSIAVLPFDDFSPAGDHEWFADGLAEEILNSLARITDLQVASRTSSFNYRGTEQDIPVIAAALGVEHILEGSVRRAGDKLRVTAQLIRASDDKHLWSENFDGSIENSIEIQEQIAFEIANALQTAMNPEELQRMLSAGTRSVVAWETYLRALFISGEASNKMDGALLFEAIELLEDAVEQDPSFADAHLLLASAWNSQINPTHTLYSVAGLPMDERRAHFNAALTAASRHTRSEITGLEVRMRGAIVEVRINEQIEYAKRMIELQPGRRQGWAWLQYFYVLVGEDQLATEAGWTAWNLPAEADSQDGPIIQSMHRSDLDAVVQMVDEALAVSSPSANIMYQSHRALLAARLVERAAELAQLYVDHSGDAEGQIMVRLRQACAEGRPAEADKLFELVPADSNTRWLFLKTLGHDDRARELLRPLDTPDLVFMLAEYLTYRSFEARDYPLLWKVLTDQGIDRPPARPMAYRCERPKD